MVWLCAIAAVCGYLLAGINPAIIMSNAIYHQDIREYGSGNPGFTNFKRVYGSNFISWLVLFLDIIKTILPVAFFSFLFGRLFDYQQLGAALTGFFCILGHSFPIWYKFKGGKSFVACFATTWFVSPIIGLVFLVVFLILLFTVKYMSLCSMIAVLLYPIVCAIIGFQTPMVLIFAILSALLVIFRHRENIERLRNGTESKFSLTNKKAE